MMLWVCLQAWIALKLCIMVSTTCQSIIGLVLLALLSPRIHHVSLCFMAFARVPAGRGNFSFHFKTVIHYLYSLNFFYTLILQATSFRGETYVHKLFKLKNFSSLLISHTESQKIEGLQCGETDADDGMCCICYACEADAQFAPCSHRSCYGCITRHLLNCQRCFFCNATVLEVVRTIEKTVER